MTKFLKYINFKSINTKIYIRINKLEKKFIMVTIYIHFCIFKLRNYLRLLFIKKSIVKKFNIKDIFDFEIIIE